MAYSPFKMAGSPMYKNFGIGSPTKKYGQSPAKAMGDKDDKTLVAKSDSMDVAQDKFMEERMKQLQNKADKSSDSLNVVRKGVINKAYDKKIANIDKEDSSKKKKQMTTDFGKEIKALNEKRSGR